jgi:methylthioribose-1-phosphate isomerase
VTHIDDPTRRAATLADSVRIISDSAGDAVLILDRRVFPERTEWVRATTPLEVADAIRTMVTQSSGPLYAAYAGLELAAVQARGLPVDAARASMAVAGHALATARPTNGHPREAVDHVLHAVEGASSTDELVESAIAAVRLGLDRYHARSRSLARHTVALLPDGARVLTHCWMDSYLIELVTAAADAGRRYEWVATETRPYLQGARLTAHTLRELGQKVTLITDGMGAAAMAPGSSLGAIDALVTAADRVSLDGSIANKVGTLGLAIAASAFEIPFYALVQTPDATLASGADIVIESREPAEVLQTLGARTASPLVTDAWYPAFDVTPPRFVTRIVTDRGDFAPAEIADYFARQAPGPAEAPVDGPRA